MPLFFQPWYLNEVTGLGSWDVALVQKDHRVIAVWPYFYKRKFGIKYCTLPPLTPYLGPLIINEEQELKNHTRLGRDKKILNQLVDQLPKSLLFISQGIPNWSNWQPLSWRGFRQTTRYTSQIDLYKSEEVLRSALSDKTRNQIVLAESKVKVTQINDADLIYNQTNNSFQKQNKSVPYTRSFFRSFYDRLEQNDAVYSLAAFVNDEPVASVLIVFDKTTAYLLATGRDQNAPPGTVSLLIWNCILAAKKKEKEIFDFEGSMIQSIESFFRSFGGEQTPYHRIVRTNGKWSRLLLEAINRL